MTPVAEPKSLLDSVGSASETTAAPFSAAPVPDSEAWFWDEAWQAGEREVDAHVAAGETMTFDSIDEFVASLGSIADATRHTVDDDE